MPKGAAIPCARLQSLDGAWQIAPDKDDQGLAGQWCDPSRFPAAAARPIQVPGNINETWPNPAPINEAQAANLDWYLRTFTPERAEAPGLRSLPAFRGGEVPERGLAERKGPGRP